MTGWIPMNDTWTVYRKEMREAFGDRHSMRGAMLQAAICILLTGIVVPILQASIWTSVTTILTLYVVFPATFAAMISADAFAGERERRTLETLLSTPLADHSIFIGKAATAVTFVVAVSGASLLAGLVTAACKGSPVPVSPSLLLGTLGGALASSFLIAALAIGISVRVPVARSAQQIGVLATFALAGLTVTLLNRLEIPLDWSTVLRLDGVVFLMGAFSLFVAMLGFHRDRFFEEH